MKNVLIIGGGLAGCTIANHLSAAGIESSIVESAPIIGGKTRDYGCKSDSGCNNCGLCAIGNLWRDVGDNPSVTKFCSSSLIDIFGSRGNFRALINSNGSQLEKSFSDIVVTTGFEAPSSCLGSHFDSLAFPRVFSGNALETLLNKREPHSLLPSPPNSVAFILCYSSRSVKYSAPYCSQVCCAYSTRAAKVIKHLYPDSQVFIFYMDLQSVNPDYKAELEAKGISFIRCRPSNISFKDDLPVIAFEDANGKNSLTVDYLFLSTGIHPNVTANTAIADITGLKVNRDGFLDYVIPPETTGVFAAGCARKPMSILQTIADAENTAAAIVKYAAEECVL